MVEVRYKVTEAINRGGKICVYDRFSKSSDINVDSIKRHLDARFGNRGWLDLLFVFEDGEKMDEYIFLDYQQTVK